MTVATLYYSTNLNPRVVVAVARHLNSPVDFIRASPRDPRNEDAFRPINPNTLVPVLVEGDKSLWETDAIACRLSQIAGSTYADFRAATIMPFAKEAKMPVGGYKNILEWASRLDEIDAWRTPFEGLH